MLVGGGVEDDVGPVGFHRAAQTARVADVANHRADHGGQAVVAELAADRVEVVLVTLVEHQHLWIEGGDLSTQLGPDRPARAGHEHAPARHHFLHCAAVEPDGRPLEEIVDRERAELGEGSGVALEECRVAGEGLDGNRGVFEVAQQLPRQIGRGRRLGDDDLVRGRSFDVSADVRDRAEHADAVDPTPPFLGVVIEEPEKAIGRVAVVAEASRQRLSAVTRPHDQQRTALGARVFGAHHAAHHAQPAECHHQEQRVDDDHRAGVGGDLEGTVDPERPRAGAHRASGNDLAEIPQTRVAPQPLVQAVGDEGERADSDQPRKGLQEQRPLRRGDRPVEAEPEGEVVGTRHCTEMDRDDHGAPDEAEGAGPRFRFVVRSGGRPGRRIEHPVRHSGEGAQNQAEVVGERGPFEIAPRELDLLRKHLAHIGLLWVGVARELAPFVDEANRRELGQARTDTQDVLVVVAVLLDVTRHLGPGPHDAHVAAQDVDQLREFVELGGAQHATDRGDSLVSVARDERARGAVGHGSEFQEREDPKVTPDPFLPEENRPGRGDPYQRRDRGEKGKATEGDRRSSYHIKGALQHRSLSHLGFRFGDRFQPPWREKSIFKRKIQAPVTHLHVVCEHAHMQPATKERSVVRQTKKMHDTTKIFAEWRFGRVPGKPAADVLSLPRSAVNLGPPLKPCPSRRRRRRGRRSSGSGILT